MVFKTEIKEGLEADVTDNIVTIKGKNNELSYTFNPRLVSVKNENETIIVNEKNNLKKTKAYAGSVNAHIRNIIEGLNKNYTYKMKIVYAHFPINLSVQQNELLIKNFAGEKTPRKANILEGVQVKINGEELEIIGSDKEKVGQTAANIEQATRITGRDIRVFQDGIYITQKG